jgi:hypothetical protein
MQSVSNSALGLVVIWPRNFVPGQQMRLSLPENQFSYQAYRGIFRSLPRVESSPR